jgi:hypothetical protein
MLPFVAIPLAFIVRRLALLFYPLLMLSVFYMLLATAVEPRTPYRPVNAWSGLYLPAYLEGRFATADDGLFHPRELVTANSTAFNLAKLAGVPGPWQLAPLMIVWFSLGASLVGTLRRSEKRNVGTRGRGAVWEVSALAAYTALVGLAPVIPGTLRAPLGERRTATTTRLAHPAPTPGGLRGLAHDSDPRNLCAAPAGVTHCGARTRGGAGLNCRARSTRARPAERQPEANGSGTVAV